MFQVFVNTGCLQKLNQMLDYLLQIIYDSNIKSVPKATRKQKINR